MSQHIDPDEGQSVNLREAKTQHIVITDREPGLPFSKGLMASQVMVTGLSPYRAYQVAEEIEDRLRSLGNMSYYLGTELTAGQGDAIVLRAGHAWSEIGQEDGTRVGLGLRYQRFDLSIAKSLAVSTITGETEPVHVTFSIGF